MGISPTKQAWRIRRQLISDAEICARYRAGEALATIGKRAGLWTSDLMALLARNGMAVRTPAEINRAKGRRPYTGTLRLPPAHPLPASEN